jgi:hypothetical protein
MLLLSMLNSRLDELRASLRATVRICQQPANFECWSVSKSDSIDDTQRSGRRWGDHNVMESDDVDTRVRCWLLSLASCVYFGALSTQSCSAAAETFSNIHMWQTHVVQESPYIRIQAERLRKPQKGLGLDSTDVRGHVLDEHAVLGQHVKIVLDLGRNNVESIHVSEFTHESQVLGQDVTEIDSIVVPVRHGAGPETYIEVDPLRLGKLELKLFGRTDKGSFFEDSVELDVGVPSSPPLGFTTSGSSAPTTEKPAGYIRTLTLGEGELQQLASYVTYGPSIKDVPVDSHYIRYRVRNGGSETASVDSSSGLLTAQKAGNAVLEASFGGLTTLTCIVVFPDKGANLRDSASCSDMLTATERERDKSSRKVQK